MAALSGDNIVVKMDDSGGTLRTFADGEITAVDLGLSVKQHDVTGFGDAVQKFIPGQMLAPVSIKGYLTTTALVGTHTVLNDAFSNGSQVSLVVQVGQNAAPTTGDPEYTGEFYVESYKPVINYGGAISFVATLKPAIGTAPSWGAVA